MTRIAHLFSADSKLCEPLSDENQKSLLIRAQGGDKQARERLVCSFTRLLKSRIKKAKIPQRVEHEELFAEGLAAMVRALDRYKAEKGTALCSFLTVVIDRALWRAIGDTLPMSPRTEDHPHMESLEPSDPERPAPSHRLADPSLAPDRQVERLEQRETIENAMSELEERGEWVMRTKFGLCAPPTHRLSTRTIDSDVTRERLHQLEALAIRTVMTESGHAQGDERGNTRARGVLLLQDVPTAGTASSTIQTRLFDSNDNG